MITAGTATATVHNVALVAVMTPVILRLELFAAALIVPV
jgi:hypothetical protein